MANVFFPPGCKQSVYGIPGTICHRTDFSSEQCVADYKNAVYSGSKKWLLYMAAIWRNQYYVVARERVNRTISVAN